MQQNEISQPILLYGGFALSVLGNIALIVKFFLERKTTAEINAYNQLSQLFESLQKQVEKREIREAENETDYIELENKFDALCEKIRKTRLDLFDLKQGLKEVRQFLADHNIKDENILRTIEEIEAKLKEISEQLK